jgi:hypothetical protein
VLRRIALALVTVAAVAMLPSTAFAGSTSLPTASVSLGDSYISGEAGRWQGNSINPLGDRDGTDRACVFTAGLCTSYDKSLVYVDGSADDGCHRSDVAEILSAAIPVERRINIACSGAVTANIFRSSNGGEATKGEAPEADQLATVARENNIKLVALSIGGNDLGFASIVQACLTAYLTNDTPCSQTQDAGLREKMPTAMADVGKAIDEVRATMSAAGYKPSRYRFVLQSYPSVLPRAAENRYAESDKASRGGIGGCPVYDVDSDWARDTVVPLISDNLKAVAASRGVQFMDLRDAFQGREICARTTSQPASGGPSATGSEWGRFLTGQTVTQGDLQEAIHPNAFGQQALGTCLKLVYGASATARGFACRNTPGAGTSAMTITRLG